MMMKSKIKSLNKFTTYLRAYIRVLKKYPDALENRERFAISKIVFYGIKCFLMSPKPTNYEESLSDFEMASALKQMVSELTPNEFINIFPISKEYDGDRYEIKDYFYTRDYIEKMDKGAPIGDKALEFLVEYTNEDIHRFSVRAAMCVSDIRKYEGHLDLMEEFMAADGYDTPNTFKNSKGDPMYVRHGKPTKIDKHNELQLVK